MENIMSTKEAMRGIARKSQTVEVISFVAYVNGVETLSAPIKVFKSYDAAVKYMDKVENADFPIDIIYTIPFEDGNLEPISSSIWEWEKVYGFRIATGRVYISRYISHVTETRVEFEYYLIGAEMEED